MFPLESRAYNDKLQAVREAWEDVKNTGGLGADEEATQEFLNALQAFADHVEGTYPKESSPPDDDGGGSQRPDPTSESECQQVNQFIADCNASG